MTRRGRLPILGLRGLHAQINDFSDTATLMVHLDLVITVDTSVAHLAGAQATRRDFAAVRAGLALDARSLG